MIKSIAKAIAIGLGVVILDALLSARIRHELTFLALEKEEEETPEEPKQAKDAVIDIDSEIRDYRPL